MKLAGLIEFYETLSPDSVGRCADFYGDDACFKDPFNEVRGVAAIERIFRHMFTQLQAPRFIVTRTLAGAGEAMLAWELHYRTRGWGSSKEEVIRGMSHLVFRPDGRVASHRDYWDAAEELYQKLPGIGALMRLLRRHLAA
ncbi:nuclear transport factor 2 family protein [Massilia agilis]|uniref:Nuclear transport factor 2 family protein n=1 Tax=Massilia agilis TaxID=1811226 RepID=A0ABT2DE51_9BURK|nr:nuclear transport factor 2 family protein [Massilia agilis]MCS0809408.1 nuclear transport factor 2 family protein [Massilia agilis]